jgi:hypothetical protein
MLLTGAEFTNPSALIRPPAGPIAREGIYPQRPLRLPAPTSARLPPMAVLGPKDRSQGAALGLQSPCPTGGGAPLSGYARRAANEQAIKVTVSGGQMRRV